MLENTVLLEKNPDDFKVRNFIVTLRGITYNLSPIGDDLSYDEVRKQRKPIDSKIIT
ncbi:hypothetical protein GOV12_08100, partial [Candidatus Pacearchaeota archaeon]|nr:hypothetical protein [Candidatus Pacearchaeota archaeon]